MINLLRFVVLTMLVKTQVAKSGRVTENGETHTFDRTH